MVALKARSRVAGYNYLVNKDGKLFNGPIYILAKVIKAVMASAAAEAECRGLYINAQESVPLLIKLLEEIGHKQQTVLLKTNNSTAEGIMKKL